MRCSCAVLYVGSRGAEPPAGPAAEQHEEQLGQGGTPGLACPAGDVSNLGTQVCAAARTTGGSEEQRSTGAQGTSTRKKTCCDTHTEVRIRADTNGTVLASAWIPLSLCTGHAVHFTWELPHIARIARARRRATQLLASWRGFTREVGSYYAILFTENPTSNYVAYIPIRVYARSTCRARC